MNSFWFAALALCWAGSAFAAPPQPAVRVGKSAQPPVIDGRGEEPLWRQTVAIRDFQIAGNHRPAADPTLVRFAWDAQHLYVLARFEESLLNVAMQRVHEVRMREKTLDGKVFEDDSLLLIVRPEGGENAYEFAVNLLGTLADARTKSDNLWGGRDFSWNSGAKVAATVHDGFWEVEMAIPWKALSATPTPGAAWEVVLARAARGREEFSSWNPSAPAGIHTPEALGRLIFADTVIGLDIENPLKVLEPGRNRFELLFEPGSSDPVTLKTTFQSFGKEKQRSAEVKLAGKPLREVCEVEVEEVGVMPFGWSVRDAGTLQPLYVSPLRQLQAVRSFAQLQIETQGRYRVAVRGEVIKEGEGNGVVRLPLQRGENRLRVWVESGSAKLGIEGQEGVRWRTIAGVKPEEITSIAEPPATSLLEETQEPLGSPGQGGTLFTHSLLYENARLWPLQQPVWLAAGVPQFLTFTTQGIPSRNLTNWRMEVRVPNFVEVRQASGFYRSNVEGKAAFHVERKGEENGLALYEVTADQPLPPRAHQHHLVQVLQLSLKADANADQKAGEWFLESRSFADDGHTSEITQRHALAFLPKPAGRQPKKLTWMLWGGTFGALDNEALRRDLLETARAVGFNEITSGDAWTSKVGKEYGIANHLEVYFREGRVDLREHLKKHPEQRLIKPSGEPSHELMCATDLLGEGWPAAAAALVAFAEPRGADVVCYDYEYPPLRGPHSCYCERCLAAFRTAAGLGEGVKLSAESIAGEHKAAWVDFMARRVARLLAKMKKEVNAMPGNPHFTVYSGYQSDENAARYGIDWDYVAEEGAADGAACGYGRPVEEMKRLVETFRGKPVVMGELLLPYLSKGTLERDTPLTPTTKARLLRLSLDASGGILIYDRHSVDGRTWHALGEVSRLVARYEPLFLEHRLEAVPGADEAHVQLLRGEKGSLLCVMNVTAREMVFRFPLPEGYGEAREWEGNRTIAPGGKVEVTLPPGEFIVYELGTPQP